LPLVLVPFAFFLLGLSWFLASTGTFIRDIGQFVGMVQTALLFLSPVFYPMSTLGPEMQFWLNLNPLTFVIESFRDVVLWGRTPDWQGLIIYWLFGLISAWVGFAWFQKTRKGFSDVL
jgi:lipopolysaccharide transport system permease protein